MLFFSTSLLWSRLKSIPSIFWGKNSWCFKQNLSPPFCGVCEVFVGSVRCHAVYHRILPWKGWRTFRMKHQTSHCKLRASAAITILRSRCSHPLLSHSPHSIHVLFVNLSKAVQRFMRHTRFCFNINHPVHNPHRIPGTWFGSTLVRVIENIQASCQH